MSSSACRQRDCTVAQTGQCLLNNDPRTCPQRIATDVSAETPTLAAASALPRPEANPTFPAGLTLSLSDASNLMGARYCRVIGILGVPDAGKTAALVCLYLLLARNKLGGFQFRNSYSLMALEQISRGARRWKQHDPPGELTVHTESKDERAAGFIHLRLNVTAMDEAVDFLLPDLPGEWSDDLIDENRTDRLAFLRAAEAIWIMVDGIELVTLAQRQVTLHRTALLLQRLVPVVTEATPIYLVISRRDKGEIQQNVYATLLAEAARLRIALKVLQIASFSDDGAVQPGTGIRELIEAVIRLPQPQAGFWPDESPDRAARQVLQFRHRGGGYR